VSLSYWPFSTTFSACPFLGFGTHASPFGRSCFSSSPVVLYGCSYFVPPLVRNKTMKARVYSSIDAHSLLHELERAAKQIPHTYSRAEVPHYAASTKIGQLHLSGPSEGEIESATLTQHSDKI